MKEQIGLLIKKALNELGIEFDNIIVEKPKSKVNGDFSSNIAMQLAKCQKKAPIEIAEAIKGKINDSQIEKIEVVAPGFINFYVKKEYLLDVLSEILETKAYFGRNEIGKGKKVNIEFVSANPTGIIHIGNARGGAYGDSLARILSFSGFDVTKEYYINDAGNQVDNLALSIKARYKNLFGEEEEIPQNGYFGQEIIEIAKQIKEKYPDRIDGDLEVFKKEGIDYLLNRIKESLNRYRITYDVFTSEKDIRQNYDLNEILNDLSEKGYIYEKDGAKWFKCSEVFDDKDHVLKKEDGSFTYLMPDIAYHVNKYERGYDKMIDVLGTDHHGYVNRLKSSVKVMGLDPDKLEVKLLQLVRLVENNEIVKMSKRSGKSISLDDLLNEIGVNAARYYFSKYSLDTQMDFDLNLAKEKSNENPVYYVSYAYARICSVLSNYELNDDSFNTEYLKNDLAYELIEKLGEFKEVVVNAAEKEMPHLITNYVYELATSFHSFYDKVRIITEDNEKTKAYIMLLTGVKTVLFNSLNLIGVIPPEKM